MSTPSPSYPITLSSSRSRKTKETPKKKRLDIHNSNKEWETIIKVCESECWTTKQNKKKSEDPPYKGVFPVSPF